MVKNGTATMDDYVCLEDRISIFPIKAVPDLFIPKAASPPSVSAPIQNSSVNPWAVWLLCLFLGCLGVHRFYLKKKWAWLQLLTLGGLGIWSLIDLFVVLSGKFKDGDDKIIPNPLPTVTWGISILCLLLSLPLRQGFSQVHSSSRGQYSTDSRINKLQGQWIDDHSRASITEQRLKFIGTDFVLERLYYNSPKDITKGGHLKFIEEKEGKLIFGASMVNEYGGMSTVTAGVEAFIYDPELDIVEVYEMMTGIADKTDPEGGFTQTDKKDVKHIFIGSFKRRN